MDLDMHSGKFPPDIPQNFSGKINPMDNLSGTKPPPLETFLQRFPHQKISPRQLPYEKLLQMPVVTECYNE